MFLRKASGNTNAKAASLYQSGLAAFETGRYLEAIDLLSQIQGQNLPATLARFYLGQAHMQQGVADLRAGCYASAAEHLNKARTINPDSDDLSRYLAACHAAQNRFDLAAAEIEKYQSDGDRAAATPIRLAYAFVRDGQFDRAVETLESAVRSQPYRADLYSQLGLLLASADRFDDALPVLTQAVRLAPLDASARQQLGLVYAARGESCDAVEHLAIAQKLRPHDAYVALLLTMALDAARAAGREVHVAPTVVRTPARDAAALESLGDLITREPDFVEAFLSLPPSKVDTEVFTLLAATLEQALERRPDYADLHHHCSRVYARLGRTDAAIDRARQAVAINPRYIQACIQLARLYADTDRTSEAIERLTDAIEAGGDYPDVHYLLGELHLKKGDNVGATAAYRRALELNANFGRAHEALEAAQA